MYNVIALQLLINIELLINIYFKIGYDKKSYCLYTIWLHNRL